MATTSANSKYNVKRVIYSNDFDEDDFQSWQKEMREINGYGDDISEDTMRQWYYDDMNEDYDMERDNLDEYIDGYIVALGNRWSHYGAICGNGRTGARMMGDKLKDIMDFSADGLDFWAEGYNVHGRIADHDGSWSMIFRVCKSEEEAERLVYGNYSNDQILARTKSLYPYIAKIYGWPYRGSKKAA